MEQTTSSRELKEYVLWTSLVALLSFGLPFLTPAFMLFTVIWVGALIAGVDRFERRGWWVLLGAPLALAWPCFVAVFFIVGSRGGEFLP